VSDVEPIFEATPALRGSLTICRDYQTDRNTLLHRRFAGGSLKVVAAKAPRFAEITWGCIEWPAPLALRELRRLVPERAKFAMVTAGEWRPTRPCRIPLLGADLAAGERIVGPPGRGIPRRPQRSGRAHDVRQYVLGEVWAEPGGAELDDAALAARAEAFATGVVRLKMRVAGKCRSDHTGMKLQQSFVGRCGTIVFDTACRRSIPSRRRRRAGNAGLPGPTTRRPRPPQPHHAERAARFVLEVACI